MSHCCSNAASPDLPAAVDQQHNQVDDRAQSHQRHVFQVPAPHRRDRPTIASAQSGSAVRFGPHSSPGRALKTMAVTDQPEPRPNHFRSNPKPTIDIDIMHLCTYMAWLHVDVWMGRFRSTVGRKRLGQAKKNGQTKAS